MPSRNSRKQYLQDSYYHIYNRGVEKRTIFKDAQDYSVFLSYLKEYLLPKDEENLRKKFADPKTTTVEKNSISNHLRLNNFTNEITLLCYSLMPNHFHFLIKQKQQGSMDKFMNSLGTRYTMYFNRKYKRVGRLYEGVYKAVQVESDEQLLYLSKYIHKQSLSMQNSALQTGFYSSYNDYIDVRKSSWLNTQIILSHFSKQNKTLDYKDFMKEEEDKEIIKNLYLDET